MNVTSSIYIHKISFTSFCCFTDVHFNISLVHFPKSSIKQFIKTLKWTVQFTPST